jgi:hypothetical protein
MTISEATYLYSLLASVGVGALVAGVIVFLLCRHYLPTYLSEKGRNLATREDIGEITDKVESVRSQYTALAEELKARHQLRLAALDRRLQAHQEAFTHWRRLLGSAYAENIRQVTMECQDWWEKNCVYLEPGVRQAFVEAYTAAHSRHELVKMRSDTQTLQQSWARITQFPNLVFQAMQLPSLTESERNAMDPSSPPAG